MSRELRFKSDFWRALHPLPTRLRTLYSVLCHMTDSAGVMVWKPDQIAEECGGKGFGLPDVEGLGDRVRWLEAAGEGKKLLVVDFLAMQNKSLSRSCRGQIGVWRAIARHWPEENGLVEAWREMGILSRLPPILDEHHGPEHTGAAVPVWKLEIERHLQEARRVPFPAGLNGDVGEALQRFIAYREKLANDATTKTDAQKRDWQAFHVREVQNQVMKWVNIHPPDAIAESISRAISGNYPSPLEPKKRK